MDICTEPSASPTNGLMTSIIDCSRLPTCSRAQYMVITTRCFSSLDFAIRLSSIMGVLPLGVVENVDGEGSEHAMASLGLWLPNMENGTSSLKSP